MQGVLSSFGISKSQTEIADKANTNGAGTTPANIVAGFDRLQTSPKETFDLYKPKEISDLISHVAADIWEGSPRAQAQHPAHTLIENVQTSPLTFWNHHVVRTGHYDVIYGYDSTSYNANHAPSIYIYEVMDPTQISGMSARSYGVQPRGRHFEPAHLVLSAIKGSPSHGIIW
jgi:hypothetical protein